ncbi:phosphoribosylanthranilate isomerase [Fructilactobacillus myrtifloralis]|uniref:N-(5'-phosphoribosyl)anthranilate isomerase n=1 Tax=Fructilactobacillus myrtifloralis TaxID=2940301 RepID=A0ABY5BSM1_9LACO|nr:phosphoribosylanthranilate isomerase [Fructilactobacillus myrtifloralis]USS85586.1 phosphoribosylanthranilate isomerase [Fructilactobacillus myrtifloralis]
MVKIKLCGLQTVADIHKANVVQPDFIGLVFAPSRRQVDLATAQQLMRDLAPTITPVGVFVEASLATVMAAVQAGRLQLVQYYGELPKGLIPALHEQHVQLIQVVQTETDVDSATDYVMFDASRGRGQAPSQFQAHQLTQPEILSGGITITNVQAAVASVKPAVVDVSSGVETDGQKDLTKMQALTNLVHQL